MPKKLFAKKHSNLDGFQWTGQVLADLPTWVDSAAVDHDVQLVVGVNGDRHVVTFGQWLILDGDHAAVLSDADLHASYDVTDD